MVGSTALWPSLLATWLSLTPVPSGASTPSAAPVPPPAIALPSRPD
ncbi:MAG: hypothetical protein H7345_18095 [Rubritepida sp.]|nr:hypothetical protein [Rubritepida sp.]